MVDKGLEDNEEPTVPFSELWIGGCLNQQAAATRLCLERKNLQPICVGRLKGPGQRQLAGPLMESV